MCVWATFCTIFLGKPTFVGGKCTIPYYHSESFMVSFMERFSYLSWDISPGPQNGLRVVAWVRAHSDAVQRASHGHSRPQWARLALLAHVLGQIVGPEREAHGRDRRFRVTAANSRNRLSQIFGVAGAVEERRCLRKRGITRDYTPFLLYYKGCPSNYKG